MSEFNKLSIGKLRPAPARTKPKSLKMWTIILQRSMLEAYLTQMDEANADQIEGYLAGWFNEDREGKYIGIQLSERYEKKRPQVQNMSMEEFFQDLKQEQGQRHNGHSHGSIRRINTPESNLNTGKIYLSEREPRLTVMKSMRISEPLLRQISKECKLRKIDFSGYMRQAAVAWIKEQSRTGETEAG